MNNRRDLMMEYRKISKQFQDVPTKKENKKLQSSYKENQTPTGEFELYKKKAENIKNIEKFNTTDLVYHFKEIANNIGNKYFISSMIKERAVFKRLLETFEIKEIVLMMEFVFNSDQDYLDKSCISPQLLASGWCNTIFKDSLLWVNDEYKNKSKRKHGSREYGKVVTSEDETKISIGVWE